MAKNLQLSGMIHAKYENESDFARALGWSRQRLNKITNGHKYPDLFEIDDMAQALGYSFLALAVISLAIKSRNVDH